MSADRLAERFFEASLRSFPSEFRERHARPMREMFRSQWTERTGRPAASRGLFLLRVLLDSVRSGVMQRLASVRAARSANKGPGRRRARRAGSREVGQAVRALLRRPGFTVMAVGTLALGIGGVASIGSVAYHVLLAPLPYADGDEIVRLWWNGRTIRPQLTPYFAVSPSMMEDFAARNRTARELTWVSARTEATLVLDEGSERVLTGSAAPNFFDFLGVAPALGRLDVPADSDPASAGIVLSHAEWLRRWGGDSSIVGRVLRLQNVPRPVIGVLRPDFEWIGRTSTSERAAYWIIGNVPSVTGYMILYPLVKPAPGYTVEDVRQDFARSAYAELVEGTLPLLLPMSETATAELLRTNTLGPLRVRIGFLLASVLFVVLVGALSVSNLLLGRLSDRDHEMGVRLSLGASRFDLVRLIAIEATLLATAGAFIGILLARSGTALIRAGAPVAIPRLSSATISPSILAGVTVLTAIVALIVLVPPALGTISDTSAGNVSRLASRGRRRARSRTLLILSQMMITTVLLIGSSLMLRSLYAMETVDLGFDPEGVIAGRLQLPTSYWSPVPSTGEGDGPPAMATSAALEADLDRLRERLLAIPGVEAVSFAEDVPLSGSIVRRTPLVLEGQQQPEVINELDLIGRNRIDTRFFDVLNASMVEGRPFRPEDMEPGAAPVAIVNDRLAEEYWPGQSAVGKRFHEESAEVTPGGTVTRREILVEVVGVVAALRDGSLEEVRQTLYYPKMRPAGLVASPPRDLAFLVATDLDDPTVIMSGIRRVVGDMFPREPLRHFAPITATVDEQKAESVFYTTLLSVFAAYGLLLSLVGIMGVIHHQISRRRHEVAVRMALGALPREALRLLGRDTARTAAVGIAIGLTLAAGLARLIESMLFEVVPLDPWTFVAIPALFLGAAVAAAVIPGRRLTRLRPADALRSE